jgi:crotonobetainyl-CoA:carnitine CoA-transferase CaiB-like acyl-CoA transferase
VVAGRHGSHLPYVEPRGAYRTADDRWVGVSGTSQSVAERIFAAIGRPEMGRDARFATNEARIEHGEELDRVLGEWIGARTLQEVMTAFEAHEAAASPIYDVQQILADLQYGARDTIVRVPDEDLGDVLLPDVQPRLSETPGRIRHTGLGLGSANRAVYAEELGLTDDELGELRRDGVI